MTSPSELEHALEVALDEPRPLESAHRVKEVVKRQIELLDPTAKVHGTTYFNHSFTPDFVITWVGSETERNLFLRTSQDPQSLALDVDVLRQATPLICSLGRVDLQDQRADFESATQATGTFLTDALALDSLGKSGSSLGGRISNNSLLQGGRTVLTGAEEAASFVDTLESGLAGAALGQISPTAQALQSLDSRLAAPQASRILNVLQAIWIGADGVPDEFPGGSAPAPRFDADTLLYLLDLVDSEDPAYWHRLGRRLQLSDLPRLAETRNLENLRKLITHNVQHIQARACSVTENPLRLDTDTEAQTPSWSIVDGLLRLTGSAFVCDVAQGKDDLPKTPSPSSSGKRKRTITEGGLDFALFLERWRSMAVTDVEAADVSESIAVKSNDAQLAKHSLEEKIQTLHSTPVVTKATVASPSGAVTVDFIARTGTAVTNSATVIPDLIGTAVPFLAELSDSDFADLMDFLASEQSAESQPTLPFPLEGDAEVSR